MFSVSAGRAGKALGRKQDPIRPPLAREGLTPRDVEHVLKLPDWTDRLPAGDGLALDYTALVLADGRDPCTQDTLDLKQHRDKLTQRHGRSFCRRCRNLDARSAVPRSSRPVPRSGSAGLLEALQDAGSVS